MADLGNDSDVQSGRGNDRVQGGDGDDVLRGGEDDDLIDGGLGNDRVIGGSDDDLVLGGPGTDQVEGRSGDDRLDGGDGADLIDGGEGNDIVIWDPNDAAVAGGTGIDNLAVQAGEFDLADFAGDITGIEIVDMSGAEASTTMLTASDVLDVSDTDELAVLGDSDDSLGAGVGWTAGGTNARRVPRIHTGCGRDAGDLVGRAGRANQPGRRCLNQRRPAASRLRYSHPNALLPAEDPTSKSPPLGKHSVAKSDGLAEQMGHGRS